MTDEQIQTVWDQARKSVTVYCDEAHQHSAAGGCLDRFGDHSDAVNVCKLAETLLAERRLIRNAISGGLLGNGISGAAR
jgi:hypothetical protein